jgi:NADH-quinone oxidoreductase subunit L
MASLAFDAQIDFRLLLAVLLIPLVGYGLQIFLRRRLPHGDKLLTLGMAVVMGMSVYLGAKAIAAAYRGEPFAHHSEEAGLVFGWLHADPNAPAWSTITAGIYYDGLGAAMLAAVGIVSFCVHLFSTGYMQGDRRYAIFFANISLFTFAMLGLVLSDNLLFLFVFWELMGAMSYLLIGHFSHDPSRPFFHRWATWASKKAFLTTRVGDTLLFIGLCILWNQFHTLRFTELWRLARETVEANGGEFPGWLTAAGLCIFGGTVGKSAQFPLHIWLPDAMAGPTPVSAMIHAATMVAAGVFLLGRCYPLLSPEVLTVVTVVGTFTALFAATIGTTAFDLKAVLANSTISQLGFMVAAVGLGGVAAGMFHMVTHAFFKACLFLSAGSVIHGCHHEQDMRKMGGLRKQMPVTFWCMLLCTIAIAGVPFFSGFYSKDQIIAKAFERVSTHFDGTALFALIALPCAACLTAFYMFRLIFMTFFGTYRGGGEHGHEHEEAPVFSAASSAPAAHGALIHGHDAHDSHAHGHEPHESSAPILVALGVLTLLGVLGGHFWPASSDPLANHEQPWFNRVFTLERVYGAENAAWLEPPLEGHALEHHQHVEHQAHVSAVATSLTVAGLGIALAWFLYVRRRDLPARIARALGLVYEAVRDKYYVDELVDATVVRGTLLLTRLSKWIDEHVVDGLVLLVGLVHELLGFLSAWFDRTIVDGCVNAVGLLSQGFSAAMRMLQTGRIQQYAAFAVAGGLLTLAWLILS